MILKVYLLERSFTEYRVKKFVCKIIELNLHILPMVFNCGLPQKYVLLCVDRWFLKLGNICDPLSENPHSLHKHAY